MTTELERSRSQMRSRFGQLSKSMFFARHVAQPRYLRFITGAYGQRICDVRQEPLPIPVYPTSDFARSLMSDPRFNLEFSPDSYNGTLLQSYADKIQPKRRRERLLPPLNGWCASGAVVDDTHNWKRELVSIAKMVGLLTSDELLELDDRKEKPSTPLQNRVSSARKTPVTNGQYSRLSGRWNETPKSASRCRSSLRRTPLKTPSSNHVLCVEENEREKWMMQVLCQILQTENVGEIQSWLVSSGPSEKEAVRQLIITAIKGLEESGRVQNQDGLSDNSKEIQVNMDSFGSLLANRFPQVLSSLPITPFTPSSSRPITRPRTAPATQTKQQSRAEFYSKSTSSFPTNLQLVDETNELESSNTNSTIIEPTRVDTERDVQVLVLDDNENKDEQPGTEEKTETKPATESIK